MMRRTVVITILTLVCLISQAYAEVVPTNNDEAKALLKRAYDIKSQHRPEDNARVIQMLRKVVSFDAGLAADFPKESIHLASAAELGLVYAHMSDYGRALQYLTIYESLYERRNSGKTTDLHYMIDVYKENVVQSGRFDWPPVVVADGPSIVDGVSQVDGLVLAPAGELGRVLKVKVKKDKDHCSVTLGDQSESMVFTPGRSSVTAGGKGLPLPRAAERSGDDVVVPARTVVEYFGKKMEWDSVARIAWIR